VPLYEYECKKCHHRFERIQKSFSDPAPSCPKCRGKVEQLLHAPAVQFKGSGWYVTDYARGSSAGNSSSEDGGGKSEEKADVKSASKSESKKESESKSKAGKKRKE
jgi:putative FmdB family regulatory protein